MDKLNLNSDEDILLEEAQKELKKTISLYDSCDYSLAIPKLQLLIPIFKEYGEWKNFVYAKSTLSYCMAKIGKVKLAYKHLQEVIDVVERQASHLSGYEIGAVYVAAGNFHNNPLELYNEAIEYYEKALVFLKPLNDYRSIATCYTNIASIHGKKNDYKKEIDYQKKALTNHKLEEDFQETDLKSLYNNISVSYNNLGKHEMAYLYIYKTLQLYEKVYDNHRSEHFVRIYNSIGKCHVYKKEYKLASHYLYSALDICLEIFGNDHLFTSYIYNTLSVLYDEQGQYEKMLKYAFKSLESVQHFQRNHPSIVSKYRQIAYAYFAQKQYENAKKYAQQALSYAYKTNDKRLIYLFFEQIYFTQKNYKKALQVLKNAIEVSCNLDENHSLYQIPTIPTTEYVLEVSLVELIGRVAKVFFHYYLYETEAEKDLLTAWKYMQLFGRLIENLQKQYSTEQDYLTALNRLSVHYNVGMEIVFCIEGQSREAFRLIERAKAAIMLSSMQESFAKTASKIPKKLLEQERQLKIELTYLGKTLQKEKAKGNNKNQLLLKKWSVQFFDYQKQYDELRNCFETDYPDYYQLKYETQTVSIEEIQQSLAENQMMVNFFVGESHLYIFFVLSSDFEVHQVEIADNFEKLVNDFLQSIHNHQFEKYAKTAYELYQYLLQPLEMHLIDFFAEPSMTEQNEASKKLLIVPHGILNYVPFEALLCSSAEDFLKVEEKEDSFNRYHDLDYLLLHCEVSYHYSATLWHYLLKQQQQEGERAAIENSFVGFAPVYQSEAGSKRQEVGGEKLEGESDTLLENLNEAAKAVGQWATRSEALRSDGSWNPLPHSKTEAQNIAALFGEKGLKSKTFLHEQATKEQFQKVVENSRFLLVAAHGVVNDEQPKLSGLVFYPEKREVGSEKRDMEEANFNLASRLSHPTSQTDCILSMEETYHLNLSKTDLVVLSSCESGIGQLAKGEGMMAVNRGFLYAGAKNVVSTLFKVYDRPSSLLTQYLFEGVLENLEYSAALRLAKLKLLKEKEVDVKSWCGFVMIGG